MQLMQQATMDGLIAVFPEENAFMTNALFDAIWLVKNLHCKVEQ